MYEEKVLNALQYLQIHDSEYKSIIITEDRLDWMNGQEVAQMKGNENPVNLRGNKTKKDQLPVLSGFNVKEMVSQFMNWNLCQ